MQLKSQDLVKSRQVSAVEVAQSAFDRLHVVNGKLNAVVIETPEDALRSAELVDQAIDRGEDPGNLAGVPVTVKVNIDQSWIRKHEWSEIAGESDCRPGQPRRSKLSQSRSDHHWSHEHPSILPTLVHSEPIAWPYN